MKPKITLQMIRQMIKHPIRTKLEQAAEDYIAKCDFESLEEDDKIYAAYLTGAEFAQRWIPVEEDSPLSKDVNFPILCKSSIDGNIQVHYMMSQATIVYHGITHWRPINLK